MSKHMSRVLQPINIEIGGAGVRGNMFVFDAGVYFAEPGPNPEKHEKKTMLIGRCSNVNLPYACNDESACWPIGFGKCS